MPTKREIESTYSEESIISIFLAVLSSNGSCVDYFEGIAEIIANQAEVSGDE